MRRALNLFTIITIAFLRHCPSGYANSAAKIDSLENVLKNVSSDSARIKTLCFLSEAAQNIDPEKARQYAEKALKIAIESDDKVGEINSHNCIGVTYKLQAKYPEAIEEFQWCLDESKKINNEKLIAQSISNIGVIHYYNGKYPEAIAKYLEAIEIQERIKDRKKVAKLYNNIGLIYRMQNQNEKAVEYYKKCGEIELELGDSLGYGETLGNIGVAYDYSGDYKKAIQYHLLAYSIHEKVGNKSGMAITLGNIGVVYYFMKKFDKALEYYHQSLEMQTTLGNLQGMAMNLNNIGGIYTEQKEFDKALEYRQKSLKIALEIGALEIVQDVYSAMAGIYGRLNDGEKTLEYFEKYDRLKDSLFNTENSKQISEMNTKYETEKKEKEIVLQKAEIEKKDIVSKKQRLLIWSVIGGLLLVFVFSVFMFNRWRVTQKQKAVIQKQKIIVDEKNQHLEEAKTVIEKANHELKEKNAEILSSISYAQRIQEAILPPTKLVKQYLQDSFVLYKPKDIVAGDFYWMEVVGEKILFAACDCTGHGVPGAFVSIVGHNGLNRAVKEFGLIEPAKILDKVNELVEETFSKSEQDIKDGMDIALCGLTNDNGKWKLEYSGANNSIYHIRNGNIDEIKADKQPIGKYAMRKPFTNNVIELQSNDSFYAFSDGYADQFGGPKGKKFKYSQFENLLVSIQEKSMSDQREILNDTIEKWKGTLEQIDDICIIGVRV